MRLLRERLARNTLTLLVSTAGSTLLAFTISVVIGRWLGEEGLGIYAATLAWIFPLTIISEFGLSTLITRDVAQSQSLAQAYLHTAQRLRLVLGIPLIVGVWVGAPFLSHTPAVIEGLRISAPLILIQPLFGNYTAVFRAAQRMWPIALLNLCMLGSQLLLTIIVLEAGYATSAVFWVNVVTSAGQLLGAMVIYRRYFHVPSAKKIHAKIMLQAAIPFAIAAVLAATQSRINILLLEQLSGVVAVGVYAAAWRFVEAGRLVPHALFDALYPRLSQLVQDARQLRRLFIRVIAVLLLYGICAALALAVLSRWIIEFTYGPEFIAAVAPLQIAGLALLPLLFKSALTLYWYAHGDESFVNRVTVAVIALQVIVGWLFISEMGVMGAIVTAIVVESAAALLLWLRKPSL